MLALGFLMVDDAYRYRRRVNLLFIGVGELLGLWLVVLLVSFDFGIWC